MRTARPSDWPAQSTVSALIYRDGQNYELVVVDDVPDGDVGDVEDEEDSDDVEDELEDSELPVLFEVSFPPDDLFEEELYKSAYQPPPFKIKPVPREICRLAVSSLHFPQALSGGSLIDCSVSHS